MSYANEHQGQETRPFASQEGLAFSGKADRMQEPFPEISYFGSKPASGLMAFPRPRSSIEDAGENLDCDSSIPVDPRLERRRKNEYKRHGSLTLAWQQRVSGSHGSRNVHQTRSRLASEADIGNMEDASASQISIPIARNRESLSANPNDSYRLSDTSSLVCKLRSRYGHLDDGFCVSGDNTSSSSRPSYYASEGDENGDGLGDTMFIPVNASRAANGSLPGYAQYNGKRSSGHKVCSRQCSATGTESDTDLGSLTRLYDHAQASLSTSSDSANRLATPASDSSCHIAQPNVVPRMPIEVDCASAPPPHLLATRSRLRTAPSSAACRAIDGSPASSSFSGSVHVYPEARPTPKEALIAAAPRVRGDFAGDTQSGHITAMAASLMLSEHCDYSSGARAHNGPQREWLTAAAGTQSAMRKSDTDFGGSTCSALPLSSNAAVSCTAALFKGSHSGGCGDAGTSSSISFSGAEFNLPPLNLNSEPEFAAGSSSCTSTPVLEYSSLNCPSSSSAHALAAGAKSAGISSAPDVSSGQPACRSEPNISRRPELHHFIRDVDPIPSVGGQGTYSPASSYCASVAKSGCVNQHAYLSTSCIGGLAYAQNGTKPSGSANKICKHSLIAGNPPRGPLPKIPQDMATYPQTLSAHAATTTACCPSSAAPAGSSTMPTQALTAAAPNTLHSNERLMAQGLCSSDEMNRHQDIGAAVCASAADASGNASVNACRGSAEASNCTHATHSDDRLLSPLSQPIGRATRGGDLARHPTIVFTRSPILGANALLNDTAAEPYIQNASASEHPQSAISHPSKGPGNGRDTSELSLHRNSLFPSVVKQQSRCMSVLLQQGPHGGIRRIGPLLITRERGGNAIKHLNPSFIDMMDVKPVDASSAMFLKKSNNRRRSFSLIPHESSGDWLSAISDLIGASSDTGSNKQASDRLSTGPGMWWPLNDDNCSDEITYDVHVSSAHEAGEAAAGGRPVGHTLERMGSSSTLAGGNLKPPPPLSSAPRKGSVSSQLRMIGRSDNSSSAAPGSFLRSNASQSSLGGGLAQAPTLNHTTSDSSDTSSATTACSGRLNHAHSAANMIAAHSAGIQLADVTMKTESGVITRSVRNITLRLLVNRLASPEGNVDSDLMTDFLNSYRFFAHPIDVMRLIIVRYLNCFVTETEIDDSESSGAEDPDSSSREGDTYLTMKDWCKNNNSSLTVGDSASHHQDIPSIPKPTSSSSQLPPLSRNDGAIIQLRVMNMIKYWIKFHPHDFRLHHRLTRLLLLFLSHIQKQPGRAEFVNSIRQKLSSGKLLAVEMPAFAGAGIGTGTGTGAGLNTAQSTAVHSQASSLRSSGVCTPTLETARSALDLQSMNSSHHMSTVKPGSVIPRQDIVPNADVASGAAYSNFGSNGQKLMPSLASGMPSIANSALPSSLLQRSAADNASVLGSPATPSTRNQHIKKGSTSYFKSLFLHRSSKNSSGSLDGADASSDNEGTSSFFLAGSSGSVRIAQRKDPAQLSNMNDLISPTGDSDNGVGVPNGNMYASDFGEVVMEALLKSGIPTPQTPVGRTLLNYSIANRNPYRINLVGIDPATFAEQLTLLEHELFSRIAATEFSLKGRVGNLETILNTMQGVGTDTRNSVSTVGGNSQGTAAPTNPVPNLTAMTSWFNQATYWAVLSVLSEPTTAARALIVKQLTHIAFHCMARRNYYGAFEIVIALDNSAVRRLHDTWALVPAIMKDIVAKILEVLQSRMNFRTYRESVKAAMVGASGPDEEMFDAIAEQIKSLRAKDIVSVSQNNIITSNGLSSTTSTGHSSTSSGFGQLVHGSLFGGNGEDGKQHPRKKSNALSNPMSGKDTSGLLTEQDCACIMYAIRIRAASFMFVDPSSMPGDGLRGGSGSGHSSVPTPAPSKSSRSSGGHLSSGSHKSNSNLNASFLGGGSNSSSGGISEMSESRSRRARSTSNSSNGTAGGRPGTGYKQQGRQITNGAPLPLVPFVAVHMTDFLHADEANATYSDEHQKMRSRNPLGAHTETNIDTSDRRQLRCDSAAISNVNQAQPLLNMQKFRLITAMFRELHQAQRTKYPYAADMSLQQQIHSAVRNIKAQANDIFGVVHDVAMDDPNLARPGTGYTTPFARTRTGSTASRTVAPELNDMAPAEGNDQEPMNYPLYQAPGLHKTKPGTPLLNSSMDWDCFDIKDNQELEQNLYMLSKWIEPASSTHFSTN
ncbi:hypothetical protein GGI07_000888 [Coemansia sp. Benny D115]|nr:hypothetical protein GGI07_000888 [Coemansia sp. Benny D115]